MSLCVFLFFIFLPIMMTRQPLKMETVSSPMCKLEDSDLNSRSSTHLLIILTQLCINFFMVLYSSLCCVWSSRCVQGAHISWRIDQMVSFLSEPSCPVFVLFPPNLSLEIAASRCIIRVPLEQSVNHGDVQVEICSLVQRRF